MLSYPLRDITIQYLYHRLLSLLSDDGIIIGMPPLALSYWSKEGSTISLSGGCFPRWPKYDTELFYNIKVHEAELLHLTDVIKNYMLRLSHGYVDGILDIAGFKFKVADERGFNVDGTDLYISADIVYRLMCVYGVKLIIEDSTLNLCSTYTYERIDISNHFCLDRGEDGCTLYITFPSVSPDLVSEWLRYRSIPIDQGIEIIRNVYSDFKTLTKLISETSRYLDDPMFLGYIKTWDCYVAYLNGNYYGVSLDAEEVINMIYMAY